MSKTNEQAAIDNESLIREAKNSYSAELAAFWEFNAKEGNMLQERQKRFLAAHRKAVCFFDLCEQSVADSSLLGAHRNALWVKNKAETSLNALDSVVSFNESFKSMAEALQLPSSGFQPSATAYASMQRVVKQHYPEKVDSLRERFARAGLPTVGFDSPLPVDERPANLTTVEFTEDGELRKIEGMESQHAASVLLNRNRVKKGDFSVSGAIQGSEAAAIAQTVAMSSKENDQGWLPAILPEAKKAPVAVVVTVIGTLMAAVLTWILAGQGCTPFINQIPSNRGEQTQNAVPPQQPPSKHLISDKEVRSPETPRGSSTASQ